MSIADQLISVANSKEAIRQAIVGKGQVCGKDVPLAGYPAKISAIPSVVQDDVYYKCASVDTTAKTWTGYKAVLSNGVYTFETTITSGLTYTSVVPVVGDIYNDNALINVGYLWDGVLVPGQDIYLKLNGTDSPAVPATYVSDGKFGTVAQCYNGVNTGRSVTAGTYKYLSVCGWYKSTNPRPSIQIGTAYQSSPQFGIWCASGGGVIYYGGYPQSKVGFFEGTANAWNFYCYSYNWDTGAVVYCNGVSVYSSDQLKHVETVLDANTNKLSFGGSTDGDVMSNVRVYLNKALTQEEVTALYNEF